MKFLIDAQLPRRLAHFITAAGHPAIHTLDLADSNCTTDGELARCADAEDRVVVTKDADFVTSHTRDACPRRLLLLATGNITNRELLALFARQLPAVVAMLEQAAFVELETGRLIAHG